MIKMPLFDACMHSDEQRVAELLAHHGDEININKQYPHANNYTTLHLACLQGHHQIATMLLAAGALLDVCDDSGETPLQVACGAGRRDMAIMLLQAGARADGNTEKCNIALAHACADDDAIYARLLLSAGANPNANMSLHSAARNGHLEMVKLLLSMGADVNHRNPMGCTPLHEACSEGFVDIVQTLLAAGADWKIRNIDGSTAMEKAEKHNHLEIKAMLISHHTSTATAHAVVCNPIALELANWMRHELCEIRQMNEADAWKIVQTLQHHGVRTVDDFAHVSAQEMEEQVLQVQSDTLSIGSKAKARSVHGLAVALSKAWVQHLGR